MKVIKKEKMSIISNKGICDGYVKKNNNRNTSRYNKWTFLSWRRANISTGIC